MHRSTASVAEQASRLVRPSKGVSARLVEVDALRGIAAVAVVLFHMSTRFNQLFAPSEPASWAFPHGHYGVNLFFIISGFVIFMTLERTRRPMDFVVSRFSRLFPSYWCAIVLTFVITHWLELPIKTVTALQALGNFLMLHGYLSIPHVDGVYWTLEVELMFYVGMFLLFRSGRMNLLVPVLMAVLALRVAYVWLERLFGIELPWTLSRLMILPFIPWFTLGICIYKFVTTTSPGRSTRAWQVLAIAALLTLALSDGLFLAALAVVLGLLVHAAAASRLPWLGHPILVWLGAISYPLYLLHENIGWSLILRLTAAGLHSDVATVVAIAAVLVMATLLHKWVEFPAMQAIRQRYRARLQVAG